MSSHPKGSVSMCFYYDFLFPKQNHCHKIRQLSKTDSTGSIQQIIFHSVSVPASQGVPYPGLLTDNKNLEIL